MSTKRMAMLDRPGKVDVWLLPFSEMNATVHQWCMPLLDAAERVQAGRFLLDKPRDQYVVSRAMVRQVLADYLGIPPLSLSFARNDHGRPHIASPRQAMGLHFSLSHTEGLIALAVALVPAVGLDVETVNREADVEGIACHYFSAFEWDALRLLDGWAQREAFLALWTVKEAYIKACGKGLSIPLNGFAVQLLPQSARLLHNSDEIEAAKNWRFFRQRPLPDHLLAVAAALDHADTLDCRVRWFDIQGVTS
ncbi:MAG: 4'-phosphopantetheinyl transferase superfamily protein [Aquabacterium sp.]|uniref:4'-phosphopantetheinyl transferase family protein n=1 Tax=Aquabacterium sp. TaxID=1872578 RepID=UPI00272236E6|nr:4'-phosphopantetheinyl transferase superfamily protein [Aquabacterium sp.]MDO9005937.1 4'-phosphopantetheinyl transferase superfamily protein [Aquabacterium sp.]